MYWSDIAVRLVAAYCPWHLSTTAPVPSDLNGRNKLVARVILKDDNGHRYRAALFSVVVTEDRKRQRLWLKRWDLHHHHDRFLIGFQQDGERLTVLHRRAP